MTRHLLGEEIDDFFAELQRGELRLSDPQGLSLALTRMSEGHHWTNYYQICERILRNIQDPDHKVLSLTERQKLARWLQETTGGRVKPDDSFMLQQPPPVRPWADPGIEYVPPSLPNGGYNAGE